METGAGNCAGFRLSKSYQRSCFGQARVGFLSPTQNKNGRTVFDATALLLYSTCLANIIRLARPGQGRIGDEAAYAAFLLLEYSLENCS